jgi:hypothetical protein
VSLKAYRAFVRQSWDCIRQGASAAGVGVAVGVSDRTRKRWFAQAGGERPKFLMTRRKWSSLSLDERVQIHAGVKSGASIRTMAGPAGPPARHDHA